MASDEEFSLHSTRSDEGGRFLIQGLPERPSYVVSAYTRGAFGQTAVALREARAAQVEVRIDSVVYERLSLFDEEGQPVECEGLAVVLDRGSALWNSGRPMRHERTCELPHLGFGSLEGLARNEIAAIYLDGSISKRPWVLRLPSFEPQEVPAVLFAWEAWPASTRVTLRRGPQPPAVIWRIEFPEIEYPKEWGAPDPALGLWVRVFFGDSKIVQHASARNPIVAQRSDGPIRISQEGFPELTYTLHGKDGNRSVRPAFPECGYLELLYTPASPGRGDPPAEGFLVLESWPHVSGVIAYPGCVRFRPLPLGEYNIVHFRSGGGARTDRNYGPIKVRTGLNRHDQR